MAKNPYAGTKTEKNLWEAFAGEYRRGINIHILRLLRKRQAMSR